MPVARQARKMYTEYMEYCQKLRLFGRLQLYFSPVRKNCILLGGTDMTFEYRQNAPVVFGAGAISALGERVKALGCKKALCVYDAGERLPAGSQRP
jgi:hypothetical protein